MKHFTLIVLGLFTFTLTAAGCCCGRNRPQPAPIPQYRDDYQPRHVDRLTQSDPSVIATDLLSGGLPNWEKVNFGGEGEITFVDGVLNLDMGHELTGLRYAGDLKAIFGENLENYTITLEAQRVQGNDLFMGLTFPVGNAGHVSLVLGGWAGAVTGISSLDGLNASENSTTQYHRFEEKQWYKVKIQVADRIICWLDGEKIVDEPRADYTEFDTHGAVVDTKPFGLFTYSTWGAIRNLQVWK